VQNNFDIPDESLKKPEGTLGPVLQYLTAARLYRPDVNQARAGVVARKALVDLSRARLLPDIGIGLTASYASSPSAVVQNNAWIFDPFNHFWFGAAIGVRWNLDILPAQARVQQAEAQLEETRALERYALGGVAVEVENAYASAVEASKREEAWARAESRTRQWISTVQDRIDLGTLDERALTEPLRAYVNARINHNYALMDSNITRSELARVTGWDAIAPHG
jgi:outer membrane protein TolC